MSTPNKRRKTNNHQSPAQPVKSLDFFFGKQREEKKNEIKEEVGQDGHAVGHEDVNENDHGDAGEVELTDEQLARKLQAEWDAEERPQQQQQDDTSHENGGNGFPDTDLPKDEPLAESTVEPVADQSVQTAKAPAVPNAFAAMGKKNTLTLQSATAEEDTISHDIPFDESPLTFDPQKYLPELRRQWASEGGHCTYALLTHCFVLVGSTTSRIKTVDTLVNMLRTLIEGDPESLLPAVWLATNSISPPYIDIELGLGGSAISKALKKVCGLDNAALKTLYNKHGDAGDVAYEAKKKQSFTLRKPKPLTIKGVYESLHKIAAAKGTGCQVVKQSIVERLVQDARGAEESRYVVRTLVQHLRIGAVKTTMLIALSRAFLLSKPPTAEFETKSRDDLRKLSKQDLAAVYQGPEELVKACFARRPNYNDLVPTMLEIGVQDELLIRCGLAMHIPLRPMLGGITRDLGEMLTKLQGRDFACEFKYDGQRAQVHCDADGKVSIFSRHLEVMTDKYPDLVSLVPKIRGESVSSFILEGEVVAVDRETGNLKPFQILANRARKDVVIQSVTVDVCLFSFDLMYLNGEELLDRPFRERRSLLRSLFVEIPNHFTWVKSLDATSAEVETVSSFFKQATDIKCEGIMVKVLDNAANPDLLAELDIDPEAVDAAPSAPPTPSKAKPKKGTGKRTKKIVDPLQSGAAKYAASLTAPTTNEEVKTGARRKALLSTYEPDKRLDSWLKVKKDYNSQTDTIDLIPVGAWHGQGRKNAWWSPILLACRDPATGSLQVVTKCISGFTDAFYKANRARYDPDFEDEDGVIIGKNVLKQRPTYVEYAGTPDVWFEPQEVWEMIFADITLSPTYTAAIGLVNEDRGLSMRFPRFLKVREDKGIEEASTSEFLAELWRKQEMRGPNTSAKGGEGGIKGEEEGDDELYE
ncbi:putative DNA ligase, ATP-dependent, nucleic acid-binding protein [Septoria linicola]|nr:putative DNA ligase, ATP-dependent, nucleic acid-binding protein [Septoria linicola]